VTSTARPGRRRGRPDTRNDILDAARRLFAELGYERATVRAIADAAGVDSRLVTHYFGSKERLFFEVVEPPLDPRTELPRILASGDDPARALATFLATALVDGPFQHVATGLIRAAASEPEAADMARRFLTERMLTPVAEQIGASHPELRASLLGSSVAGLVLARHILRIEPLAGLDAAQLAEAITPVVRYYLLEPLAE
jgi:AcrR family transcriptional regulator